MTANEVYEASIDKWAKARGIGTLSYDSSLSLFEPAKTALSKYFAKNPNNKVIVVVSNTIRIDEWATKLVTNFDNYDKIEKGLLQFITIDSIIARQVRDEVDLVIFDQIDKFITGERLNVLKQNYIKFKFVLGLTNIAYPDSEGFALFDVCRVIDRVTKVDVITHGISEGVVEYNYGINMSENDRTYYNEINQFIKDTIGLLGDFDTIMRCYNGEPEKGISADYFRTQLAYEKGWQSDLDLSNEYWKNVDRYFNPNSIYDRVKSFVDAIKKRQVLLSDNPEKIGAIVDIISKYRDKKILIINKRSEFAKRVSDSINSKIEVELRKDIVPGTLFKPAKELHGMGTMSDLVCVEYHPDVESRPLIDPSTGDYVKIKSGNDKGKNKIFGATSLNKIANERFKEGYHNVVSSISSMPKEAEFEVDFMIITSPECNTFNQLRYRVSSLKFKSNPIIVNVFIKDSKEVDKLNEKQTLNTNKIIELFDVNELKL